MKLLVVYIACLFITAHLVFGQWTAPFAVIEAKLPLRIGEVDLQQATTTSVAADIEARIKTAVSKCYSLQYGDENNDSLFKIQDIYLHTLQIQRPRWFLYVILLRQFHTNTLEYSLLYYDRDKQKFIGDPKVISLAGMYAYQDGKLVSTSIKQEFNLQFSEIEAIDDNHDGLHDFKLTYLYQSDPVKSILTEIVRWDNGRRKTILLAHEDL